jgi:hypothetical protein
MKRKTDTNRWRVTPIEHAEMQSRYLVGFLNTASDPPEHAEVLRIFERCVELDDLRRTAPPLPVPMPPYPPDEIQEHHTRKTLALRAVNKALRGFQFLPQLGDGLDGYRVDWIPGSIQTAAEVERSLNAGDLPISSLGAVKIVLEMTEAGTLDRIRKCPVCQRWFFAQTNKKAVCSDACRFQKFKQNPTLNKPKDRVTYMQKYRKNPRVKAKAKAKKEKRNAKTK